MMQDENSLREKAIEFLLNGMEESKKPYEFSAKDLSSIFKRNGHNIYPYMDKLVEKGLWKTRLAYDTSLGRNIRVWWMIEE